MLNVVTWKWGDLFGPEYVNTSRRMFERHLRVPHRFVCFTDDDDGLDPAVSVYRTPNTLTERYFKLHRCGRRLQMHDWDLLEDSGLVGERILQVDLDVVLVGDVTPLVDRPESAAFWRVGYAGVYSGSFQLYDAGYLNGMWREFAADPDRVLDAARPRGRGAKSSDQDVINRWLSASPPPASWTDADGFVVYFGRRYRKFGGPGPAVLPQGARVVVLGSEDKQVMDDCAYGWVEEHWR